MFEKTIHYLTSKEVKKELKVQDCELSHLRNRGFLKFIKKGNSFLYFKESIDDYKTKNN